MPPRFNVTCSCRRPSGIVVSVAALESRVWFFYKALRTNHSERETTGVAQKITETHWNYLKTIFKWPKATNCIRNKLNFRKKLCNTHFQLFTLGLRTASPYRLCGGNILNIGYKKYCLLSMVNCKALIENLTVYYFVEVIIFHWWPCNNNCY